MIIVKKYNPIAVAKLRMWKEYILGFVLAAFFAGLAFGYYWAMQAFGK